VLFAASGIGKSSVLLAGLPGALKTHYGDVTFVVQRDWHAPDHSLGWLEAVLSSAAAKRHRPLILVFDQFEDYFLYRSKESTEAFENRLATILGDDQLETHLLLSLRDDALHELDKLRLSLPSVLDNTLELEHLDEAAVREAIVRPIEVFNAEHSETEVRIGVTFVDDLLAAMRSAAKSVRKRRAADDDFRVELPFLQLTLQKLWERMRTMGRTDFETELLNGMEGVDGIVRAHLDGRLARLNEADQLLAIRLFHYLVTPSGSKIAYEAEDLANLASATGGSPVNISSTHSLLARLAAGESRVLRRIGDQFELFHDVLARPILDWCSSHVSTVPFAYLIEVWLGTPISFYGAGGLFERWSREYINQSREYSNQSPLALRMISRAHFLIMSDGALLDMRSRFGTTVNAKPHHFGDGALGLRTGDIVGVGNTAALVFHMVLDPKPDVLVNIGENGLLKQAGQAWGLLIDGRTRSILPLFGARLHLARSEDGKIVATSQLAGSAFAVLECRGPFQIAIRSLVDAPRFVIIDREDAFHDEPRILPLGAESPVLLHEVKRANPRSMSDFEGARRGVYCVDGEFFEIILRYIYPELEGKNEEPSTP
jgi:hypothetical protein